VSATGTRPVHVGLECLPVARGAGAIECSDRGERLPLVLRVSRPFLVSVVAPHFPPPAHGWKNGGISRRWGGASGQGMLVVGVVVPGLGASCPPLALGVEDRAGLGFGSGACP
jgi:hypothetical protein